METATDKRSPSPTALVAWCLLLTLAWGLWLWRLDASDLTFDEAGTYRVARLPLLEMAAYLRKAVREHPPVYFLLMHVWMGVAGTDVFVLRLFSAGAGLVALTLTGWLGRVAARQPSRHADPLAFLFPVALLVTMPGVAYYARSARMYSLGMAWTALSAGLFLRDWTSADRWPRRTAVVSLGLAHTLALFTHYYLLLPIVVQPLVLLVTRRRRPLLAWCGLHVLPAVGGLAWLMLAPGLQATAESLLPHIALIPPEASRVLQLVGKTLFSPVMQIHLPLLCLVLALAAGGIVLATWRRRKVAAWLVLTLTVPLLLAYTVPHPPKPRFLLFLVPSLAVAMAFLCAAPLHIIRVRWLGRVVALGLVGVGMWAFAKGGILDTISFIRSRYGHTLELVQAYAQPGDGVLFYGPWQWVQFRYYARQGDMPPITTLPRQAPPHLDSEEAQPVLEGLLDEHRRLWVLPTAVDDVDPPHFVEGWLRSHTHLVWETRDFSLHLPPLPDDAPSRRMGALFGEALLLERVAWEPQPVLEGQPLRVALYWEPLEPLEGNVRVSLSLIDEAGYTWNELGALPGAWAHPPLQWKPGEVMADYEGLMVPWGAPPGEYTVRLAVSDEPDGTRLPVGDEDTVDLFTLTLGGSADDSVPSVSCHPPDGCLFLPVVMADWDPSTRAPVLYGLPNPNAASFCSPDGETCVTLAGYEPGGVRFQQGYPLPLVLHWLAPGELLPELSLRLQVVKVPWLPLPGLEAVPVLTETLPLAPAYPAPEWSPRRLVTLPMVLMLPADAATGPARVTLTLLEPDGGLWTAVGGDAAITLFDVIIEGRPVMRRLPDGLSRVEVDFGDEVGLRGYRVTGSARPGGQLRATYAWYARAQPTRIYAVFNHLVAADGTTVAQTDGWPQGGRMLSIQWQPGEFIEDSHTLEIPSDAPPGPYVLAVGLYNAANGERQPAFQEGQRLAQDRLIIPLTNE